ncbi:rubrerythrin family protein [Halocatena marina]|uniref:rubrerythrin family protein n=1 Tax=Halocatena marina TaxID=2934937 RepID=UPI0020108A2E|nr:rubrerythrin family protein [Halocatena marina]
MDADAFVEQVNSACATELERLGSEKALIATTDAELETTRVLKEAILVEQRAKATFEAWVVDESDENARAAFERTASQEDDHAERIITRLKNIDSEESEYLNNHPDPEADAVHRELRALETTQERVAAGMVGRPLVSSRTLLQTINFFINEADESTADLFRTIRAETDAAVMDGAMLLETVCETDTEKHQAEAAAISIIETAYEEYAQTLDEMGLDPRPLC